MGVVAVHYNNPLPRALERLSLPNARLVGGDFCSPPGLPAQVGVKPGTAATVLGEKAVFVIQVVDYHDASPCVVG